MKSRTKSISLQLTPQLQQHLEVIGRIYVGAGFGQNSPRFLKDLSARMNHSPDPEMALRNLLRFIEASFNQAALLHDLTQYPVLLETVMTICGTSQYFADILVRDPELFRWLTASTVLKIERTREELVASAHQSVEIFRSIERKINALKRFQRREILRIGVRDILNLASLETTTRELSHLADAIVQVTTSLVWKDLTEKIGSSPLSGWAILGLGKLGGEELNYSSDIDIIGAFHQEGTLITAEGASLTLGEFFTQFFEQVVHHLSAPTEEGILYRVDTRLRPDGKTGPLIRSFASTMTYYEARGELWERQMLLKARRLAGDEKFAQDLLTALSPFMFPRSFLRDPLEEIARIKSLIETKSGDDQNIKLRAGGIRDIEFIVQALQLLNAGRNPRLRTANTLCALERLQEESLLKQNESTMLRQAYIFFRIIEHRLQILEYTQTHRMPTEKRQRQILATRCGMEADVFEQSLKKHLTNVRKIFDDVFSKKHSAEMHELERFVGAKEDSEIVQVFCEKYQLQNRREALRKIKKLFLGSGLSGVKEYTEQTRSLFREISNPLLEEISQTIDPDRTLLNLERILTSFRQIDSMYRTLQEFPFRKALLAVAAASDRFSRTLSHHPSLTDMIMTQLPSIAAGQDEPLSNTSDLHNWKLRTETRIALRLLLQLTTPEVTFSSLSAIADTALHTVYEYQRSHSRMSSKTRFCIVALGKLGGREINFGSDLDIIFFCDPSSKKDAVQGEQLASAMMSELADSSLHPPLFDVDARLRPEGRNAPLAVTPEAYHEYLQQRASLWERQSLTKARWVAGDKSLGDEMIELIKRHNRAFPLPTSWKQDIIAMRRKTESRHRSLSGGTIDLKIDAGGLMDIEFITQALILAERKNAPDHTSTIGALEWFGSQERYRSHIPVLIDHYRFLRTIETAMRIGLDTQSNALPTDPAAASYLARWMRFESASLFRQRLQEIMKGNRSTFELILPSLE